jgi:hypothetical protein
MKKFNILALTALVAAVLLSLTTMSALPASAQGSPGVSAQGAPPQVVSQAPPAPHILGVNDPGNPDHLTVDQQKQAIALDQAFISGFSALKTNTKLTDKQKMAKFLQLQSDARQKYLALLTPQQKTVFEDRQNKQEAYAKGSIASGAKADAIQKQFFASMTPTQKQKWADFNQSGETQMQAIMQGAGLTDQQKAQKIQDLRVTMQAKLKTFLSPPQLKMLEDAGQSYSQAATLKRLAQESGN